MEQLRWTLDELAERVGAALAVDYPGQPSGRVRDVPDRRAIRWYTTIGLIDRPIAHRGRVALYGPRHLLQLVAVKRLQARGLPLVAIQQELAGATDAQLARVARLPALARAPNPARRAAAGPGRQAAFWHRPPPAALAAAGAAAPVAPGSGDGSTDPAAPEPAVLAPAAAAPVARPPVPAATPPVASLRGVRLGEGATLLLEPGRELDTGDVLAIVEAAGPLLAALRARGLGRAEHRREHP
jgi:hypothetical protein